jgi:hypothetical protein
MDNKIDPSECDGSPKLGHSKDEYEKVGLSPCGKYVAHWIEKSCRDVESLVNNINIDEPHNCLCASGICPCGSFISHKVSDPCPYDIGKL